MKYLVLFFLILSGTTSLAQSVYFKTNYGFFQMADLKNLQNDVFKGVIESNIDAKITESFPPQFTYAGGVTFRLDSAARAGFFFESTSTKGGIYYSNLSDELSVEQTAVLYSIGGTFYLNIYEKHLNFFLAGSVLFSQSTIEYNYNISNTESKTVINFESTSIGIEPGFMYSYDLAFVRFNLSTSYLFNISSPSEIAGHDDVFIHFNNGENVDINWSGFRLGIGLELILFR